HGPRQAARGIARPAPPLGADSPVVARGAARGTRRVAARAAARVDRERHALGAIVNVRPGELFPLDSALRGIRERFSDAVIDADRTSLRERTVVVPATRLAEVAHAVADEWGGAFVTLFGLDERAEHGRFRLHVTFSMAPEDAVLTLIAAVPADAPHYPAVSATLPAAAWCERELHDLLGVVPSGHPDPRPLVAHDAWPVDAHPLRKSFAVPREWDWAPRFTVPRVEGDGVFE